MTEKILITGGAGYIGSHTTLEFLLAGKEVVVLDNLCNGSPEALLRIERLCGKQPELIIGDICDASILNELFDKHRIAAVLHFAGLKSVSESVREPLAYYENNVMGSLNLCKAMARAGVYHLVFSSSATVYGDPAQMPIHENVPTGALTNPYGRSKLIVEQLLQDLADSDPRWSIAILRYFNPVGAHSSGLIGEDPQGTPNNLLPYVAQVAIGRFSELAVYGNDYPTRDGTGVRDYIHVVDLASGHLKALQAIESTNGVKTWNLGTGTGYTVLEVIKAFERASGRQVPYRIVSRRPGDVAECWASPAKAAEELDWHAVHDLETMMIDLWRWQLKNPRGYSPQAIQLV
ncbi:UDP-glucose 4-epimerase GalE [Hydrogenophaga aromaticivorans]|uniref:UDP-glucose 4-epimerase GalE n=1 Tax=Hydrogenophaga aromaticivorans TaxID=2610898 RepID=UPI001B361EE7|nr:UDP-glucose 4-epimerase GalE [Hydrogenophaga aromaticivorans]MBQ0921627.1 UDP-glucose 4-epimerase GalE [Hydrogenophaga aromaticivorans]